MFMTVDALSCYAQNYSYKLLNTTCTTYYTIMIPFLISVDTAPQDLGNFFLFAKVNFTVDSLVV